MKTPAPISTRVGNCPLEQRIAQALDAAQLEYQTDYEGGVAARLDFYLPRFGVHIEVKGGHTPRIGRQMERASQVIVAQGEQAVALLASLIAPNAESSAAAVGGGAWVGADLAKPETHDAVIVWGRLEGEARPDAHE